MVALRSLREKGVTVNKGFLPMKIIKPLLLIIILFPLFSTKAVSESKPLRIGITAVLIEQSINSNLRVAEYIGSKLKIPVEIAYRRSYREINEMLGRSEIDIAFVCGAAYTMGKEEFNLELLAAPLLNGKPLYRSYVIVPSTSEDKDFFNLRGKRYAFTDPLSNSGYLVPVYWLYQRGENPDSFFKKYIFTRGHYNSIEAVAMRIVDGASVESYVWEQAKKVNPSMVSMTRVIKESEQYPFPPVVARRNLDPGLKKKVLGALLSMKKDPDGRGILMRMGLDGFIMVEDGFYDPLREMQQKVKGNLRAAGDER